MKNIHRPRAHCDWDSSPRRLADGRACRDTDCMNEPKSNQTLDIQGTSYKKVGQKVGWGVALVGLGIGLFWWAIPINRFDLDPTGLVLGIFLTFSGASPPG